MLIDASSALLIVGGLGTAIAINWFPAFVQFQKFEVIVILWLAGSALADVMITISLVWNLVRVFCSKSRCVYADSDYVMYLQRKRQTGFPVTDDVINRIIRREASSAF